MTRFQERIEVQAPVEQVYAAWAAFERYPEFMTDVREVRPLGGRRLAWRTVIWGEERAWEAEIVEQIPNERIAWRSLGEPRIAGAVAISPLGEGRTQVTLSREIDPEGFKEHLDLAFGDEPAELRSSLERFKRHLELRATPPSAAAAPEHTGTERAIGSTLAGTAGEPVASSERAPGDDLRPNVGMSAPGAVTTPPEPLPPGFTGNRGRESAPPDAVGVSQQGGGTGGMGGGGSAGDDTGTGGTSAGLGLAGTPVTGAQTGGERGRSSTAPAPVAGGVAVSQGRGSDLGATDEPLEGGRTGMSGGSFGGSRESDVGAGLSDGMRSAHGADASGGMGSAADNQPGLPQGQPPPPKEPPIQRGGRKRKRAERKR